MSGRRLVWLALAFALAFALVGLTPGPALVPLIGISNTRGLAFGELVAGGSAGTAVLTPAGTCTFTGGASAGNSGGVTSASFTVTGVSLLTFSISLPSSTALTSGGNSMTVNTFTSSPSGSGQIGVLGSQVVTVGATLQVGASQSSGSYSGSFSVTVVYN